MATQIEMLRAYINSNVAQFVRDMDKARTSTIGLRQAWSDAARDVSAAAARVGAAVAGMGTAVLMTFGRFEMTMKSVGAITRTLGTRDFKLLEDAARKAGEETKFSASESASAMEELGLAGLKTAEIIAALPQVLQLAASAKVDIATAAQIAAKTMRAYGLQAEELTRVNDTLVATFTMANTDLLQLAEALKHVGPVAASVNMSLEDTTAILAKMADAGFTGSLGGTSLRNALIRLASPTKEAKRLLKEFGIDTTLPLIEILGDLQTALAGVTEENERLAIVSELFGVRGGPAMLAVLEVGADKLREFSTELTNSGGVAASIAAAKMDTLSGAWDIFTSKVESFTIEAGAKLAPTVRAVGVEMDKFLDANKPAIVSFMADTVMELVLAGKNFLEWAREAGPAIAETTREWWEFIKPVLRFIAESPRLMAALALLKAGQLLGINAALKSLTVAFYATGQSVYALGVALRPLMMTNVGPWFRAIGTAAMGVIPAIRGMHKAIIDSSVAARVSAAIQAAASAGIVAGNRAQAIAVAAAAAQARAGVTSWVAYTDAIKRVVTQGFAALIARARAVNLALLAVHGGLAAIAGITLFVVISQFTEWNKAVNELNRALLETARLDGLLDRRARNEREATLRNLGRMEDPEMRARAAEAKKAEAEKQQAGLDASAKGARANAARHEATLGASAMLFGDKVMDELNAEARRAEALAEAGRDYIDQLANLIDESRHEVGKAAKEKIGAAAGVGGADVLGDVGLGGPVDVDKDEAKRQKAIGEATRAAFEANAENAAPGFGGVREFLDLQPSVDQLNAFMAASNLFTDAQVAQFTEMYNALLAGGAATGDALDQLAFAMAQTVAQEKTLADAIRDAQEPAREFAMKLNEMRGVIPDAQLQSFTGAFRYFNAQLLNGSITFEQWQQKLSAMDHAMSAGEGMKETLGDAFRQLGNSAQMQGFRDRMAELQARFVNGAITLDGFNRGMEELKSATEKATEAAKAEAAQKQRQQMLAPFQNMLGGLNPFFRKVVEDKLLAMMQQQWESQVNGAADAFLQMNGLLGPVMNGLERFGGSLHGVSDMMQRTLLSGEQISQGFATLTSFMNSNEGAIGSLRSNISLLQQNMNFMWNKDRARALQIGEQIEALEQQLAGLLAPQQPLFTEFNGPGILADPGLQSSQTVNVAMDFPNLNKLTNQDARTLVTAMNYELQRQGRAFTR